MPSRRVSRKRSRKHSQKTSRKQVSKHSRKHSKKQSRKSSKRKLFGTRFSVRNQVLRSSLGRRLGGEYVADKLDKAGKWINERPKLKRGLQLASTVGTVAGVGVLGKLAYNKYHIEKSKKSYDLQAAIGPSGLRGASHQTGTLSVEEKLHKEQKSNIPSYIAEKFDNLIFQLEQNKLINKFNSDIYSQDEIIKLLNNCKNIGTKKQCIDLYNTLHGIINANYLNKYNYTTFLDDFKVIQNILLNKMK